MACKKLHMCHAGDRSERTCNLAQAPLKNDCQNNDRADKQVPSNTNTTTTTRSAAIGHPCAATAYTAALTNYRGNSGSSHTINYYGTHVTSNSKQKHCRTAVLKYRCCSGTYYHLTSPEPLPNNSLPLLRYSHSTRNTPALGNYPQRPQRTAPEWGP